MEASSGSTSIAMALASAQLGLRFVAVMPEGVSQERRMIIESYGGEVVFSPRDRGHPGRLARAAREATERRRLFPAPVLQPRQPRRTSVPNSPGDHRADPGRMRRRRRQRGGDRRNAGRPVQGFADFGCAVAPFAARPVNGQALDGAECCSFSGRIPGVVDGLSAIYAAFRRESSGLVELDISDDEALDVARALIRKGFPVGPSSGLNYRAAMMAADRLGPEAHIVTVFPDRMERYFSTELFGKKRG